MPLSSAQLTDAAKPGAKAPGFLRLTAVCELDNRSSGVSAANLNTLAHISALAVALAAISSSSHSYRSAKQLRRSAFSIPFSGAGVLQIGVQKVGSLSHAGRTDHETVDVIAVHQRRDTAFSSVAAALHQALRFRQVPASPPVGHTERHQRGAAGDAGDMIKSNSSVGSRNAP